MFCISGIKQETIIQFNDFTIQHFNNSYTKKACQTTCFFRYEKMFLLVLIGLVVVLVDDLGKTAVLAGYDGHTVHLNGLVFEDTTKSALDQLVGINTALVDQVVVNDA